MKVACTLSQTVQISEYDYIVQKITEVFDSDSSFNDVMAWAESHGCTDFYRLTFSEVRAVKEPKSKYNIDF